jgi:hypothetical protein
MEFMELSQPLYDPNDEGGAGGAAATATVQGDTSVPVVQTTPNPDPLGVETAQRNLAVAQLNTVLSELKANQDRLEAKYDTIAASTTKAVVKAVETDSDVPAEIQNDPAYKLLKQVSEQNAKAVERLTAVEASMKASQDRQSAFDKQAKTTNILASERRVVTDWLEKQVIPNDPTIKENPILQEALRMAASDWLDNEFDPDSDIGTQEAQLQIKMGQRLTKLKGAVGTTTKRDAALETDKNAKNNLSAGTAARPDLGGSPDKNPYDSKKETAAWLKWKMTNAFNRANQHPATV